MLALKWQPKVYTAGSWLRIRTPWLQMAKMQAHSPIPPPQRLLRMWTSLTGRCRKSNRTNMLALWVATTHSTILMTHSPFREFRKTQQQGTECPCSWIRLATTVVCLKPHFCMTQAAEDPQSLFRTVLRVQSRKEVPRTRWRLRQSVLSRLSILDSQYRCALLATGSATR